MLNNSLVEFSANEFTYRKEEVFRYLNVTQLVNYPIFLQNPIDTPATS